MTDGKLDPDEIVTDDDLDDFRGEIEEMMDETPSFDPDDVTGTARDAAVEYLDHLADPEACDSDQCESFRQQFGITPEEPESEESESEGEESESEAEGESEESEASDEGPESDADSGEESEETESSDPWGEW